MTARRPRPPIRERAVDALADFGVLAFIYGLVHFIAGLWHHPGIDALRMPIACALGIAALAAFRQWLITAPPSVGDEAWASAWLYGSWRSLTQRMTSDQREHAAAAVERVWAAAEADDPDLDHNASRKEIRWWR